MSREDLLKGISIFEGKAKLKVTKDLMEAYVIFEQEPDIGWTSRIKEILTEYGINHGILEFPQPEDDRWIVARGTYPVNGEDGSIELYPFGDDNCEILEGIYRDDRTNFTIINVKKGQVVARKKPPTTGTPGTNIFGEEVPPEPGKWPIFKIGEGVEVSSDDRELLAMWPGKFEVQKDGTITVLKEWEIPGSVDLSTGNIVFWGEKLIIRQSIMGSMEVRTEGDLEVGGNIEDEAQVTVGGNLRVRGIIRAGQTRVFVSKDLACGAVEYANLTIGGDVELGDYMLDAECNVKGHLFAVTGKGLIAGGAIRVGGSIAVKVLGSQAFVRILVLSGRDPVLEKKYRERVAQVEETADKIHKVKDGLSKLIKLEKTRGKLEGKGLVLKESLTSALMNLIDELERIRHELREIEGRLGMLQASKIQVWERVYPNCIVGIENARLEIKQELGPTLFKFDQGTISVAPLIQNKK